MGLDTTHDCWHGSYSAFNRFREKLAEVAGYGDLNDYRGFGGTKCFPGKSALEILLSHSDCDGEIAAKDCIPLAAAMEALLPALETAGDGGGHIRQYADRAREFIAGLREAAAHNEAVEFR